MKVWVVTRFAHQSFRCFGVFSSGEKVNEYITNMALADHRKDTTPQERRMRESTIIDRYWDSLQLDVTEEEVDPIVSD